MMAKYYLIHQCESANEIGRIVTVKENESIKSVLGYKRYGRADKLKCDELSGTEYKYYYNIEQSKRVKCWRDGMFKKIYALRPGDLCKAEIDKKYVKVKIVNNSIKSGEIVLKCETEDGYTRDVPASCIYDFISIRNEKEERKPSVSKVNLDEAMNLGDSQAAPFVDGYYILTKKYSTNEPGTLFHVRNGNVMMMPKTSLFMNGDGLKKNLVKLDKCEAEFLQKFAIDKRMKRHAQQRFQIMKDLQIGQECHLRKTTVFSTIYVIRAKNITHDGVKFDLSTKKSSYIAHSQVDAFDIVLDKEFWKNMNNLASSFGRMSKNSGSSYDDQATGTFEILELIHCEPIELNVINPSMIRKVDNDRQSLDKYIVLITKKTSVVKLLWKGLVDERICLGCELLTDWDDGTNGKFNGEQLFDCKYKRGILISLAEVGVSTCERENGQDHKPLNGNEIVAEEHICCADLNPKLESKSELVGKSVIFEREPKEGEVKWHGLLNGKEYLGIYCSKKVDPGRYEKDRIVDVLFSSKQRSHYNLDQVAIILVNDIPTNIYCELIKLEVINPSSLMKMNKNDGQFLDKYLVIIAEKRFIVKLLWKGLVDGKICLGCELLTDWKFGTNGRFNGEQLFDCKQRRGVLIPLEEGDIKTCERANIHNLLNNNAIIAEDQICCVDLNSILESNIKWVGKTVNFGKEPKFGEVKWQGLVNGKDCLGIYCSKKVEPVNYGRDGIIDIILSKKYTYNLNQIATIQVNDIPTNIYCEHIELEVVNPFSIKKVYKNGGQSLDKYLVITKKRFIVKLLWKGLVDERICLGCELLTDWDDGTSGRFNGEQLFDCQYKRGILIPLTEDAGTCERENGQDHKSLNANEIVAEEQICCVESKKYKSGSIEIGKTKIFGYQPKPTDVRWQGLVNGKECLGIIGSEKVFRDRYKKDGIIHMALNMTPQNFAKMAVMQVNDNHIEIIQGVFVACSNNVKDWVVCRRNGPYDIGQFIKVAPFYGLIECFIEDFTLVAIRLDNNQIHEQHEFLRQIMFKDPFFRQGYQGVVVKTDFIQKFNEEFRFINNSWTIDPSSIKYQTESPSKRFKKNDVVKSVFERSTKYFKIHDLILLNNIPCVKAVKATSSENCGQYEYLCEENVCETNVSDIETKFYLDTFLDPRSVVVVEELLENNKFAVGDKVEFCLRTNDDAYQGTIHRIVKVNSIRSSIVELETKVDEIPKEYNVRQNTELNYLCENIDSSYYIVPLNILKKLQDRMTVVKDIYMINPKEVETCKGKITKEKFIIFKCNGKQHWALLKWKGYINENIYCLGCEINCESGFESFGTNGIFGRHDLFKCINGCGVLIPLDKLEDCCVKVGHRKLLSKIERIDENSICCLKRTDRSLLNPRINIHERIKKISSKEIGIFRWVGLANNKEVIGIDSSNLMKPGTDGSFCGVRLFDCNSKCGALFDPSSFAFELKQLDDINVSIIDPFNLSVIENGGEIRKLMYINMKDKRTINIKWRGCIDGYLCVGCELMNDSEYGTNGTFANKKLFDCVDRRGVLIPVEEFRERCELGEHKEIAKIGKILNIFTKSVNNFINPDHICCVEWLDNIKKWPELGMYGKMKYGSNEMSGLCRWIGLVNGKEAVGVEMDVDFGGSNGRFSIFDLFSCPNGHGALFMADDIIHDVENEKLHFIVDKIVDTTKVYNIKALDEIRESGIRIGEPVILKTPIYSSIGEVKWLGIINNEKCVGLDMEERFKYGINGMIRDKFIFECLEGHGLVTPFKNVKLSDDGKRPHFMDNGIINPNKYVKCEEQWNKSFLEERNVKKDNFVFVVINEENKQIKKKGTLRWCGLMNQMTMAAVEMTGDHEYGTDGRFWRHQLFKCPDKRAIAASWSSIYEYLPYEQKNIPNDDRVFQEIDINSAVKYYLAIDDEVKDLYGTIKWSGIDEYGMYLYGLELDDRLADGTDGTFKGQRLFHCRCGHGILAPLDCINKDLRFMEKDVAPEDIPASKDSQKICHAVLSKVVEGVNKGIQGNANSCYFDSALFALFATSDVLDFMISPGLYDIEKDDITKQFREIIAWKIVYPLRDFGFVSFHKTSEMRDVITKYGKKFAEMTKQESDMENVSALLAKLCPDDQLLSMKAYNNCKNNAMFLQLFLILQKKIEFMTSEEMLKVSMMQNEIIFDELPGCLIMQAPRDAKGINCYKYVLPSNTIEISQICSNYFKTCYKCKDEAKYQCKECLVINDKIDILSCNQCEIHKCRHDGLVDIPESQIKSRSKVFMELKAIICIEKCHFVAYVKQEEMKINGPGKNEKQCRWYFFDSMSTQSISNNYAVPKVTFSNQVSHFLSLREEGMKNEINSYGIADIQRIVNDSYIFVYHNPAKTCY